MAAVLPLLELVGGQSCAWGGGSLPSTLPPAEEEEDGLLGSPWRSSFPTLESRCSVKDTGQCWSGDTSQPVLQALVGPHSVQGNP